MDKSKISTQTVISFILGVIVGIIIMSLLPDSSPTGIPENSDQTALNQPAIVGEAQIKLTGAKDENIDRGEPVITRLSHVTVANQPAGSEVVVTEVALNRTTWVAVKEELPAGGGSILGAQRLESGLSDQATIKLLRPTVPGGQYAVLLYEDNGDLLFDHKTDQLLTELGQPLVVRFTAGAN